MFSELLSIRELNGVDGYFHPEIVNAQNSTIPVNVGVVLDMDTMIGKMGLRCISMALSDFSTSHGHYKTRIVSNSRNSNGSMVGAVEAELQHNYDAVVGDITIIANRSLYVDFTLPYTESGVTMIVPVKDRKEKSAWVFLKPLTWDLWVTSA
ncbi:hypothetical protein RJ639_036420 [Escallonia herrerae]|uniref:Uncharacterized protein n=1 Tax=Escallonia herrerae TaxID=1293975 RepID=A0AA88WR31_9ASTE|nr:hypothetical protein RJ639_036420 [Escallonia herrerae]